jgi:hypothetical protein
MSSSPQSLARRLAPPFFLPAASSYHEVLTAAQLYKADAACAEADAARRDEGFCHATPRLSFLRLLPYSSPYPTLQTRALSGRSTHHPPVLFCHLPSITPHIPASVALGVLHLQQQQLPSDKPLYARWR